MSGIGSADELPPLPGGQPRTLEEFKKQETGQRNAAIAKANRARAQQAAVKDAMRKGVIDDLALVKGDLNEYEVLIAKWPIERLIRACRKMGPSRTQTVLEIAHLSPSKKVKDLDFEKRLVVARLIYESRPPLR